MTKQTVKIIVEGQPGTGKIALSLLIVELFNGLGLNAKRIPNSLDAPDAADVDRTEVLRIVDILKERGMEFEVSERELPNPRPGAKQNTSE